MTYLKLSLLSVSLAALMLGCGTESDEDPLVPEIESIIIEGTDSIHSFAIAQDQLQLLARVTYTDGSSSVASSELDWESNDTNVVYVHNGIIAARANHGTAAITATYRGKLSTEHAHNVTIEPLIDINITSGSPLLTISKQSAILYKGDTNDSGPHQLYVYGTFGDGNITANPITNNILWNSSDTNVSLVSTSGLLTLIFDKNACTISIQNK